MSVHTLSMSLCTSASLEDRGTAVVQSCPIPLLKGRCSVCCSWCCRWCCPCCPLALFLRKCTLVYWEELLENWSFTKTAHTGKESLSRSVCLSSIRCLTEVVCFFLSHLVGTWGFCGKHFIWAQIHHQVPDWKKEQQQQSIVKIMY